MKPDKLRVELTNRCNLKCFMCDIHKEMPKQDFGLENFGILLSQFKKLKSVSLTGGEPFLLRGLAEYYRLARRRFPAANINISTNGTQAGAVARFCRIADRRTSITVSFDGHESHDKIRGVPGAKNALLQTLSKTGHIRAGLKFTITKHNCHEILTAARLAKELGMPFQAKMIEELSSYHNRHESLDCSLQNHDEAISQLREALRNNLVSNKTHVKQLIKATKQKAECNIDKRAIFVSIYGKAYICRKREAFGTLNNISESYQQGLASVKSCNRSCMTYVPT